MRTFRTKSLGELAITCQKPTDLGLGLNGIIQREGKIEGEVDRCYLFNVVVPDHTVLESLT